MIIELSQAARLNLTKSPYLTEGLSMAILGNKGAGKSWAMAVVAEECHNINLPFVIYDPNGDACSLRQLGDDVIVLGRINRRETIRRAHYALETAINDPRKYIRHVLDGYSLVVDLSGINQELKLLAFTRLIDAHFDLSEDLRESTMVLVDEAHRFAPQKRAYDGQKESLNALTNVMSDGRKRGILLVVATQRMTFLNKDVLFGMNVRLFGKVTWPADFDIIKPYLPPGVRFKRSYTNGHRPLNDLQSGEFYVVSQGKWGLIRIKGRRTADLGATPVIRPRRPKNTLAVKQLSLFERSHHEC